MCTSMNTQACCGQNCQSYSQKVSQACACQCQGKTFYPSPTCSNAEGCISTCMTVKMRSFIPCIPSTLSDIHSRPIANVLRQKLKAVVDNHVHRTFQHAVAVVVRTFVRQHRFHVRMDRVVLILVFDRMVLVTKRIHKLVVAWIVLMPIQHVRVFVVELFKRHFHFLVVHRINVLKLVYEQILDAIFSIPKLAVEPIVQVIDRIVVVNVEWMSIIHLSVVWMPNNAPMRVLVDMVIAALHRILSDAAMKHCAHDKIDLLALVKCLCIDSHPPSSSHRH